MVVGQGMGGEWNGKLLFNGYRDLVLQGEKSFEGWLHSNMDVLNTIELYTSKMINMVKIKK